MSIFLDQKYLTLISNRLPLFKRKTDNVFNCRCIICGDSQKHKSKARGYFFHYKSEIRFKCHNCDVSMAFGTFLKKIDSNLHNQYLLESYSEGQSISTVAREEIYKFEAPAFKTTDEKLIDSLLDRLDTLDADNEAVQFCIARKIPKDKFKYLYYIDNIKKIVQLNSSYKESIKGEEPRLVIPFFDENGTLTGVTCRALRGEALRYITVRVKEGVPLIFNLESIDRTKPVHIVEGPIDSLFLSNAVAVGGSGLNKVDNNLLTQCERVYIYDNQPRNKEVCKLIERTIDQGSKIVIWPQNIVEKDINEMVLAGKSVQRLVKENTYDGLTAKIKFFEWKRV